MSTLQWVFLVVLAWLLHISRDQCPHQYTSNVRNGREGFPSIAYKVICLLVKNFIQAAVAWGHPGARNDKHIVRRDYVVMSLLAGNGFLKNSNACEVAISADGALKASFHRECLVCNGGYYGWPSCLTFPVTGQPDSPLMKFSRTLKTFCNDEWGVFRNLNQHCKFLKAIQSSTHAISYQQCVGHMLHDAQHAPCSWWWVVAQLVTSL